MGGRGGGLHWRTRRKGKKIALNQAVELNNETHSDHWNTASSFCKQFTTAILRQSVTTTRRFKCQLR